MKIYLLVIEDRHADVEVKPYSTSLAARVAAEKFLRRMGDKEELELTPGMREDGWVFLVVYSAEGDCIRILERDLDPED